MRFNYMKATLKTAALAVSVLLLGANVCFAQQQINLTAGPSSLALPDGSLVPMWGYTCDATQPNGTAATCAALHAGATGWSPVVITVPTGQGLQINLTNNLSFANGTTVPTSLTIVGQLGGGLGTTATAVDSPNHPTQTPTWVGAAGAANTPPPQGKRVRSFSTEVAVGTPQSLIWTSLRPGTYLIESGTHPSIQGPMGLYGILVVTTAPSGGTAGTAYPAVTYNAEIPLLLSEIDPRQNNMVNTAVNTAGFSETETWTRSAAGGPVTSVVVSNPGMGYATAPTVTITGTSSNATAVATVTNGAVTGITISNAGDGYATCTAYNAVTCPNPTIVTITPAPQGGVNATATATVTAGGCGGGAHTCYPPVVDYTPLYYLFNGVAFDKTNAPASLFPASIGTSLNPVTGNVLVRLVNAGLKMHVPSIVGTQTGANPISGFSLIAEDGNPLPGVTRVQSEVFMAAGKTYDVMINVPAAGGTALPIFDRELSLSGNAISRDAGMLAYIGINGAGLPAAGSLGAAAANPDTYNDVLAGHTVTISDPGLGVLANDFNVYGVKAVTLPSQGTLNLYTNGTFTYAASAGWTGSDSFMYCGNGTTTGAACAIVTLGACTGTCLEANNGITVNNKSYTSNVATFLSIKTPGILLGDKDAAGYPLTVAASSVTPAGTGWTLNVDANGGFTASVPGPGSYTFAYKAQNSQGTLSASAATVTLIFPTPSNLAVTVLDGNDKITPITDYRWIIEEDRTFFVDPNCTTNPLPAGCPTVNSAGTPAVFGTNFHSSYMPVVATGCTGQLSCEAGQTVLGAQSVCDVGDGVCRPDISGNGQTAVDPKQVVLDPTKRYYISVFPGDAAQPFISGYQGAPDCSPTGKAAGKCGHGMGGAPIAAQPNPSVTVLSQPSPYPPATLTVFVFEDDWPLNGEHDAGGGVDVLSPQEPGLGGFQITLFDDAGGTGDATGQPTYDMFNQPLSNSLAGTIDPTTGMDACPISTRVTANAVSGDGSQKGITGMIVTCPKYESDGKTLSPLAGQAVVKNLYAGRYGVVARPGADRISAGEEWLQTNTLDGQKAHDSFMRIGEPAYFQEFGPAGYHVSIGFANPAIINARKAGMCTGGGCSYEVTGHVSTARMSRPPDERLYGSGSHESYAFTQCYASLGDPDGADFAFVKCDKDGNFDFTGMPGGNWKLTLFDQWNDQVVDGISTPVGLPGQNGPKLELGEVAVHQWQANFFTRTFLDLNGDGVSTKNPDGSDAEPGLALVKTNVRYRDGSFSNRNNTDLNGYAAFNEEFPLFNWYVIETDVTRYKNTGTHVVYDAGGPTDGTSGGGTSKIATHYANTIETNSVPTNLRVPGGVYCDNADCGGFSIATGPIVGGSSGPTSNLSTGRIDPPWVLTEGWQGFAGQNNFLEFGKKPYVVGENGGIRGHVVYSSTRPFDDPQFGTQNVWEPLVPNVTVNLYLEGKAPDGSISLTLIDHTLTSSFDAWAQGFRSDGIPNMNCPGQSTSDLFFYGLQDQPNYLDWYNSQHGGSAFTPLPDHSQFKCYDGMHNWNQLQPAPYDGMYQFPSVTSMDPVTGKPNGTNCTACAVNPDTTDPYRAGSPMLPKGRYVVEMVVPPGYELTKEEDKNILIGDNYIAPATQEFGGLGNIFILPDQAEIDSYNANSAQNPTNSLGRNPILESHEGDTATVSTFWPCVGELRTVPDYISLFPQSKQVAPFAGASRNLCDRKEVTLDDQTASQAEFFIWTPTHIASHFTGVITDDFTAEFDPFSPQFGEKFAPANLPVSIKDWAGNEVSRTYSDQWGAYTGLNYSTWEVNPPNPTGYAPTMMVTCMNDPGTGNTPDPLYQPGYSQFCYELPFMPGQTGYFDTPVVPTSSFSEGYNHPDCAYPDATPAIASVTSSDIAGPWVSAAGTGHTLTINTLGNQGVNNYGYSGPSATTTPFNQKTVTRHYGFGSTAGTVALIGSDGVAYPLTGVSWSDLQITGTVPTGVPNCAVQQQAQYAPGATAAQCGQLVITASNGKQSVDTVTVTIGGKAPTLVGAGQTIQSAIDRAAPGDMIMVPLGVYTEFLLMWKPIRLQGVGAISSIINANTHPAGKLDSWRRQVGCLFGLTPDGRPNQGDMSCMSGWTDASGGPNFPTMVVDRVPMEGILGWDTTVNGNLAEQLIEPSLMGAYEGAAITVLGKGVNIPAGAPDAWGSGAESAFPANSVLLTGSDCATGPGGSNLYPSNFYCNPSSIDGLSLTNSSQGGGGIFVHAWGHNIQIANNRVHNNTGTLSGGITVGEGEHVDLPLVGGGAATIPPGSCESAGATNQGLPYCYNLNVSVHHNAVTLNSSMGDELFSSTPAGGGGVTFCNGADYYKFNYNWVCGNMSTGDGGGVVHLGFSKNGDIEHNSILFNQSSNPTITTNGGGLLVMGAPDPDPPCGAQNDKDCVPDPASIPPSDGTGPGLVINANLIMGNAADSGSGGGLRLQHVNGTDVLNFPDGAHLSQYWNSVSVTNNIITNNVAGWDGGGVSLQDALNVNIVNNTIASNDSTASAGPLFGSLFAPLASTPGVNCTTSNFEQSCPQVAGLVSVTNSGVLVANLPPTGFTCPSGHGDTGNSCAKYSVPLLANNMIWQNRSFVVNAGSLGSGTQNQQTVVTLYNSSLSNTPGAVNPATVMAPSQPQADATSPNGNGVIITGGTGACTSASYWDIGVRGDLSPTDHSGGLLAPFYSIITSTTGYDVSNSANNPSVVSQYCNGSRVPPELGSMGYTVNPGTNETNALPTPVFTLTTSATVDEGNNWINLRWGPLAMTNPVTGTVLGNFAPAVGSPAIDAIPKTASTYSVAPATDFFGNKRPDVPHGAIDVGAVEAQLPYPIASVGPTSLAFGNVFLGSTSGQQTVTLSNTGTAPLAVTSISITGTNSSDFAISNNPCPASLAAGNNCVISVTFTPTAIGNRTASLTIASNDQANPTLNVGLTGTGVNPPAVNPTSLAFGNVVVGTTSTSQTLTLTNPSGTTLTGIALTFSSSRYSRPTGGAGGTCGTTLNDGSSCTINVVFSPTAAGSVNATLSITGNEPVAGSPVPLSGTGVAATYTATVAPSPLPSFGSWATSTTSPAQTLTVTNTGNSTLAGGAFTFGGGTPQPFSRPGGSGGGTCGTSLAVGASCTINVVFAPTTVASFSRTLTVAYTSATVTGSPVALTGNGVNMAVNPAPLAFANQYVGVIYPSQTLTVRNSTGSSRTLTITVTTGAFSRPSGGAGGTCGTTLNNGSSCTINVVFTPTAQQNYTGSVTITTNGAFTVANSPVTLTGAGVTPSLPKLAVLDNFNRANSTTLGSNWNQFVVSGTAAIQVNGNLAFCNNTGGIPPCGLGGTAYWTTAFGSKQAAAVALSSTTVNSSLVLKASGTPAFNVDQNFIRVIRSTSSTVLVQTTTNWGINYTTIGTLTGSFAANDTITALVDAAGAVLVWKTTSGNVITFLGGFAIPTNSLWTGGGSIGLQLPNGATVDNYAGGTVP